MGLDSAPHDAPVYAVKFLTESAATRVRSPA